MKTIVTFLFLSCLFGAGLAFFDSNKAEAPGEPSFSVRFRDNISPLLEESMNGESDPEGPFWLNSGGLFYIDNEQGATIQGDLPEYSKWRELYAARNPLDTEEGKQPQNLFRLLTKNSNRNTVQEVYFKITKDNVSESPNRNASNGIFLIHRYEDSNNLYYTGLRVDGTAVIKRKLNGVYTTLAQKSVFEGDPYDRHSNPSLIPKNSWIGLRGKIESRRPSSPPTLQLELDVKGNGTWKKILHVEDSYQTYRKNLPESGRGGIRADFMDVVFKNYSLKAFGFSSENRPLAQFQ